MKIQELKAFAKKQSYFKNTYELSDSDGSITSDDEIEVSKDVLYKCYNNRYIILKYLSRGTFCRFWLVYDIENYDYYAMKVFFPKYYEDSLNEIKINKLLKSNKHVIKMYDNFCIDKSNCIIYELMGITLMDVLDEYENMPIQIVKKITLNIAKGLDELHKQNIIHCDLKSENIMFKQHNPKIKIIIDTLNSLNIKTYYESLIDKQLPELYKEYNKSKKKNVKRKIKQKCTIILRDLIESNLKDIHFCETKFILDHDNLECKLIDLGNSEIIGNNNIDEIMIRMYRPPENIMNEFYNEKSDIWALGCIVYEMLTNEYLFDINRELSDIDKNKEHLHQMFEMLGKIPKELALNCDFCDELFDSNGRIKNMKHCDYVDLIEIFIKEFGYSEKESKNIYEFLKKLLDYNVNTRYSANNLINDIWLNN